MCDMLNDRFETRERILVGKDATLFVTCETWDLTIYPWDPQGRPGKSGRVFKKGAGVLRNSTGNYVTEFETCETCVTC